MIGGARARMWGTTAAERRRPFPCDRHLSDAPEAYFRAVDIAAPPPVVFRWLCQLRAAPYSYDWLDNGGRRSPRRLTPGLERLAVGQRVMRIFRIVEFEPERHLTLVLDDPRGQRFFGGIALSYVVVAPSPGASRLLVKLLVRFPARGVGRYLRWLLPFGDLVMMRKQLLTLKGLAEHPAA